MLRTDARSPVTVWSRTEAVSHCHGNNNTLLQPGDVVRLHTVNSSLQRRIPIPPPENCWVWARVLALDPMVTKEAGKVVKKGRDLTLFRCLGDGVFPMVPEQRPFEAADGDEYLMLGFSFHELGEVNSYFIPRAGRILRVYVCFLQFSP